MFLAVSKWELENFTSFSSGGNVFSIYLSDGPADDNGGVLGVGKHAPGGVVEAEVGGAVDDDSLHRHSEAAVQSSQAVGLVDLGQTVSETAELSGSTGFAYISSQPIGQMTLIFWKRGPASKVNITTG